MALIPPPQPQPLGIFNDFIARQPETLLIRERSMSLSGDDFQITTATGQPIIKVSGKAISLSGRKQFTAAANGNLLFELRKQHVSLKPVFYAKLSDGGERLFEVRSKLALLGSKAECTFKNAATNTEEKLVMKGSWTDLHASILHERSGMVVATIQRQMLNMKELIGNKQTYHVTVAQGVDLALISAMAVALDEAQNDEKK